MGKRGKRRRRNREENSDPSTAIDKKQKVDSGDSSSSTQGVQVAYHGQDRVFSIPPPLNIESAELVKSDIQTQWRYLAHDKEWKPTPIQEQLWSILLKKEKNVIAIAPTGSGKTMAYGIPTLSSQKSVMVLVPTRELCQQVCGVYMKLVKGLGQSPLLANRCKVVSIYGGVDRNAQKRELSNLRNDNVLILVATPGRLLDILQDDSTSLSPETLNLGWIVLDEADQLSKDGDLGPQVDQILERVQGPSTSLVLVSATFPETAKDKFEAWVQKDYVLVQVNSRETSKATYGQIPSNLKQVLHVCSDHKKPKKLMTTIRKIRKEHVGRNAPLGIVFFARIERLKYVGKLLEKDGIASISLHSQLSTEQRAQNLETFKCGKQPLLLATDVAARGIDIAAVQFVIQYDFPSNLHQYIHRCGRAGRSGSSGTIYSFFTRNLKPLVTDLIGLLESTNAWVDPNLRELVASPSPAKMSSNNETKGTEKKSHCAKREKQEKSIVDGNDDKGGDNWQDDYYPELAANRIVLKRASHVSDASSSSEDEDDEPSSTN
eukprot:scaffold6247_cov104-Cylindrotheca_fusiformis.AAC.2